MTPDPPTDASDLLSAVTREVEGLRSALAHACALMGSGHVWNGPAATRWQAELDGRSGELARAADRLPDDVREAMGDAR